MELCRRWGITESIRAVGFPADHTQDIAWVTAVGGHEIYRVNFPATQAKPQPPYTPESDQVCSQNHFTPVFLQALTQDPTQPLYLSHRLDQFQQTDTGITAAVTDLTTGDAKTIQAQYLVACDGARSRIREACGVVSQKYHDTSVFQSLVFNAPKLAEQLGDRNAMVFFLVNPILQEPLRAVDGKGHYRLILKPNLDGTPRDPQAALQAAFAIDTPIEIVSNVPWRLSHRVVNCYRQGRIFFAGDAAHTLSPSGGFGMNTGLGDALDLGWKLAATLKGWAGNKLLDSYETERRPIAVRNLEEANANLQRTQNRTVPPLIASDSPAGAELRQQMALGMERSGVRREFDAPGVHLGFRYESDAIAVEPHPPSANPFEWQQTSYPGCRAPHAWLKPGHSTLDLFGHGFVLLSFQADPLCDRVQNACQNRGIPFTVYQCDRPEIAQLYERSYVLVRPDGHVAWRGDRLPDNPDALIDQVRGC
jgi:2-polyprenyl-6-methoxyphenol hydroxylase-like FAD-dependent oxidoreductase